MLPAARAAVIIVAALAPLLAGAPAGYAGAFCDGSPVIEPGVALGAITLGMPALDLHHLLMVPGTKPIPSTGAGGIVQVAYAGGPNSGIMQTSRNGIVVLLALLEDGAHTQGACHTPKGIHLGSSMNDVSAAYGWPPRTFHANSGRLFWVYDQEGLAFAGGTGTQDDVTIIEVFKPGRYCETAGAACQ